MKILIGVILPIIVAVFSWSILNNIANSKDITYLEAKVEGCQAVHSNFQTHLQEIKDSINIIESDIKLLLRSE